MLGGSQCLAEGRALQTVEEERSVGQWNSVLVEAGMTNDELSMALIARRLTSLLTVMFVEGITKLDWAMRLGEFV